MTQPLGLVTWTSLAAPQVVTWVLPWCKWGTEPMPYPDETMKP
jgi:hypothetical protein